MKKDNKIDLVKRILGEKGLNADLTEKLVPRQVAPIKKLEPEFIPVQKNGLFGMDNDSELKSLVGAFRRAGVERVNFCYPLNEDIKQEPAIIEKTINMAKEFSDSGFSVSLCNIDSTGKINQIKQIAGDLDWVSYFNKNYRVPEVEKFCSANNIPFVPGASNAREINDLIKEGHPVIKAIPYANDRGFINQPLHGAVKRAGESKTDVLFNVGGGVRPAIIDPETNLPTGITDHFKIAARTNSVVLISATQPVKAFLYKSNEDMPLEKIEQYFNLINTQTLRQQTTDPEIGQ